MESNHFGPGCLMLRCPNPSCGAVVDQDMIRLLAPDEGCEYAVNFDAGNGNYDNINVHYHLFEDLRSLKKAIDNKADGDKFRSAMCNIGMITLSSKILSQDKGHFSNLVVIAAATIEVKSIVNVMQFLEVLASFDGKTEDGHMVLEFNHLEPVSF
ncbi:hypothetical protein PIB30_099618 [Stylosanthes scabra]|uniref:Uncharacterized protein n=1 Tax=Stylosanthes scabra TaxID=79078 RepID=A0ABU6QXK7_9FABA|nr:hypothetical protein [Stylosanthes scabra]